MEANLFDLGNGSYTHAGCEYSHDPMGLFEIDGKQVRAYSVMQTPMSESDAKVISYNCKIANIRKRRNKIIAETDWMANSDVTMTDAWKRYRQQLRDLPASASPSLDSNYDLDLTSVTWPSKPS